MLRAVLLAVAGASVTHAAAPPAPAAALKPNIVYLLMDDFGWGNFGLHNNVTDVVTPHLDALASGGLLLERHYVFKYCSPSRCALQTGRNPIHVNVINNDFRSHNASDPWGVQGIPPNMTTIATKLRGAGYTTHAVGKWNAGIAHAVQTPAGRGFDTALTYADYMNDFWTESTKKGCAPADPLVVDLWDTHEPGAGLNGSQACSQAAQAGCTYQDELFVQRIAAIIANHTPGAPLFLLWAPHAPHDPYQVPQAYLDKFAHIDQPERRSYSAMVNLLDDNVGRVVAMLTAAGLWDNTLLVASSDNGGPQGSGYGGNNFPLRGAKATNWEGGVRVNAFVAGGALPPARRGATEAGLIEMADWYTTFCALAGVDPVDELAAASGLPPVDGLDMWPLLSGANATSPRTHVVLGSSDDSVQAGNTIVTGVVRADGYKLLLGKLDSAYWTGPLFPNTTGGYPDASVSCGTAGCLFNVFNDPSEYAEISAAHPAIVADLQALIADAAATVFNPSRGGVDPAACAAATGMYGGFWGPWLGV